MGSPAGQDEDGNHREGECKRDRDPQGDEDDQRTNITQKTVAESSISAPPGLRLRHEEFPVTILNEEQQPEETGGRHDTYRYAMLIVRTSDVWIQAT